MILLISVSNVRACDPILESLILSKSSIDSIDMLFRDFSTRLTQLGREARTNKIDIDTLVNTKLVWLKVYEKYYLRPPKSISNEHWVRSIDKIAQFIKIISKSTTSADFENTHTTILKIQNTLVSIYDGSQNKSFYAKTRMIQHLFHLHKKSLLENLQKDAKTIESRLESEWTEMTTYFNKTKQKSINFNQTYIDLFKMSHSSFEAKKNQIFKSLEEMYWKSQN